MLFWPKITKICALFGSLTAWKPENEVMLNIKVTFYDALFEESVTSTDKCEPQQSKHVASTTEI